jgi:dUTP pyrophosphatase
MILRTKNPNQTLKTNLKTLPIDTMINKELFQKLKPEIYADDPRFIPVPAHRKEDAGADLRAFVPANEYEVSQIILEVITALQNDRVKNICIDGKVVDPDSISADTIAATGGCVSLLPGETKLINSGFKIALPNVEEIYPFLPVYKIVSRSGLSCKHKISVTNRPGIVDKGYRDWIAVSLENEGHSAHIFTHGARIAQGLYELVIDLGAWDIGELRVNELSSSNRGENGFGSTGLGG